MHQVKETVCNDPNPHERGEEESADYCDRRKGDGDDQFPDQGMTRTAQHREQHII